MASILKLRPFVTQIRRYRPKVMETRLNDDAWWYDMPLWSTSTPWSNNDGWNRSVNMVENDKVWKLSYDLPGIKAKDLSVKIDGSNVQISASRNIAAVDGDSKTIKKSRIFQSFPVNSNNVDLSQLKANLSDGVLVISAPKKSEANVNQIKITTDPHPEEDLLISANADDIEDNLDEEDLETEFESIAISDGATKSKSEEKNEAKKMAA